MNVVVVGAGQAGLAVSRELGRAGVEHVVLERGRVGQTWRDRWDSFCLVTPNWSVQLPGHHYDGDDPDGFMPRDEIVSYLERYAETAPIHEGVAVTALRQRPRGGFGAAIFAGGFRPDHASWVHCPDAFDEFGFPVHEAGASSVVPGLYFVGVHFLRKRKSSLLIGVGDDAEIVANRIAEGG